MTDPRTATSHTECPHKPGTDEWRDWTWEYIRCRPAADDQAAIKRAEERLAANGFGFIHGNGNGYYPATNCPPNTDPALAILDGDKPWSPPPNYTWMFSNDFLVMFNDDDEITVPPAIARGQAHVPAGPVPPPNYTWVFSNADDGTVVPHDSLPDSAVIAPGRSRPPRRLRARPDQRGDRLSGRRDRLGLHRKGLDD